MTNYSEILRLKSLGFNHSQIAASTEMSRPTVITVLQKAAEVGHTWQTASELSDVELARLLFPQSDGQPSYKMPKYEYVHRVMARSGVTPQLLWFEYFDQCREDGSIPYQLTQFKKYCRDFVVKTKVTMHINRKPGEIMEVDWAGQTAEIIDTDTGEAIDAYVFVSALLLGTILFATGWYKSSTFDVGTITALALGIIAAIPSLSFQQKMWKTKRDFDINE